MSLRTRIAEQFERPNGMMGRLAGWIMANRPSNRLRNEWTTNLLDINSNAGFRILEIGCGPGIGLTACLRQSSENRVVGIDHSPLMITQAARRLDAAIGGGRAELWTGDLSLLPQLAAENTFDRIYSVNVIQFLRDKDQLFQMIYSSLAKGGIAATTYQPRHKNPTRQDALRMGGRVVEAMTKAGFANIRMPELSLEPVPAICVLGEKRF